MSDAGQAQGGGAVVQQPAANDGATAGALLRRAREAAGLHVAALAVQLKVPVRKLEALESDRWDVLTDAVFVRALALSVCRSLKIDPQPILERLPRKAMPRLAGDDDGINTPFRAPGDGVLPRWLDQLRKPVFLAVFALLLGALVLVLLPTTPIENKLATMTAGEAVPVATTVEMPQPAEPQAAQAPAPSESTPAPSESTPASAESTRQDADEAQAPSSGVVVFRTSGPSWIEVTDAKGAVALRKMLETGESAGVDGALPLRVTIGRADNTEVQVRGKPYDLKPVSKDNVARFEVK